MRVLLPTLEKWMYYCILSILKEGLSICPNKYEFLAFSAGQLRGSSVWMFASNDSLNFEDIRKWMGHFEEIRQNGPPVQLAPPDKQLNLPWDVEEIPDIEVTTNGTINIVSDGIGKILRDLPKKPHQIGLDRTNRPLAFQIRYGSGSYKGVVVVDLDSFRPCMMKFESKSTLFNITSWSKAQPFYMNLEVISLLWLWE